MRKYLGVLAGVAALCAMSWAQAPDSADPDSDSSPGPDSGRRLRFQLLQWPFAGLRPSIRASNFLAAARMLKLAFSMPDTGLASMAGTLLWD